MGLANVVLMRVAVILGAAVAAHAGELQGSASGMMNPIRKVVTLLQNLQTKVQKEGEKEKDLYDKFMCYCKSGQGDLSTTIAANEGKVPAVGSDIKAAVQKLEQSKSDLSSAQSDRTAANGAIAEAKALRGKEAMAFAAEKAEKDTNIAAITKAVAALEKGMIGGFIQTSYAQTLRKLASNADMLAVDRQDLLGFLDQGSGYSPSSGSVTGILKQLGDTMAKDLEETTATENGQVQSFQDLVGAKTKEIGALTGQVETKTTSIGELGVQIVQMKEDLSDSQASLAADQKFLQELQSGCDTKESEWQGRVKTRGEEQVALADAIKMLNDDEALDLFKKTLPSPGTSFAQVRRGVSQQGRALSVVRDAVKKSSAASRPSLDLLALALGGQRTLNKGGFDKVIKMVDNMVVELGKEQVDDDHKLEYCQTQFDSTDDKKKTLTRDISDADAAIATTEDNSATLSAEITTLQAGIKGLDKSVQEATEQRKNENVEFKELMAADSAAVQLLGKAKNRLAKFYNPAMYAPPPKRELSREDKIYSNLGGEMPAAPVLVQVSLHAHSRRSDGLDSPAPPPATWDAYQTKSGESNGVVAMIDLLIKDLDKELTEAKTEESNSQKDYEQLMGDSAEKRATDTKSLTEKSEAKADTEMTLQGHKEGRRASGKELMAVEKYGKSLALECDWLVKHHDVRKEARASEVESLKNAKAVLNGADYSLLQRARNLRRDV